MLTREKSSRKTKRRAEKTSPESAVKSLNTLDFLLEGCQVIGFDWRYIYLNNAAARHGHSTRKELLGHTMMEVYPGIETTKMFARLQTCMDKRTSYQMDNEFTYPDGTKGWFDLRIEPVPQGIFILSLDITERKRSEERIGS